MSEPIFPKVVWPEGIAQASVPANINSLRDEALNRPCLGVEDDVADPADGDVYIVGPAPTGAFSTFSENDLALARVDELDVASWHAWAPVDGLRITMHDGTVKVYVGESTNEWQDSTGGDAVDSVNGHTGTVVLDASDISAPVRTETASYIAALGDSVVIMNLAGANDFTVPPNGDVAFPVGTFLEVWQQGTGQTTIVAGSGVTLLYDADDTLKLKGQNAGCSLRKVGTNTWRVIGKMETV
jgi:hypothetical protein